MPPSPILVAIKELAQYLGAKLDKVLAAVKATESPETDLKPIATAINNLAAKIKEPKVEVSMDTSSMEEEMHMMCDHMQQMKMPDMTAMENLLISLSSAVKEGNKAIATLGTQFKEAIAGLSLNTPDTIKIDEMQLRSLRSSSDRMPMQGGLPIATRVSNTTVAAASPSSEYSYTFPAGTLGWVLKLRDQGTLAYYSWTTGKLPSGDGTAYLTIPQNFLRSQEGVDYSGKTIYLGAESASQTFEIEVFRL